MIELSYFSLSFIYPLLNFLFYLTKKNVLEEKKLHPTFLSLSQRPSAKMVSGNVDGSVLFSQSLFF
jgi:hypothetical protein